MSEPTCCPRCGSDDVWPGGAVGTGDGDLYDEWFCESCGENFPDESSRIWIDDAGDIYHSEDEYWGLGTFDEEDTDA